MNVSHSHPASYVTAQPTHAPATYPLGSPEAKSLDVYGSVETWHPLDVCTLLNWEWKAHICVYRQTTNAGGSTLFRKIHELPGPLYEHDGVWPMVVLHFKEAPQGWRVLTHNEQVLLRDEERRSNPDEIVVQEVQQHGKRYASIVEAFYDHALRGQIEHYYANRPQSIDDVIRGLHRHVGQAVFKRDTMLAARAAQHGLLLPRPSEDVWEDVEEPAHARRSRVHLTLSDALPRLFEGAMDLQRISSARTGAIRTPLSRPPSVRPLSPPPAYLERPLTPSPQTSGVPSQPHDAPGTYMAGHLARSDRAARNDLLFHD